MKENRILDITVRPAFHTAGSMSFTLERHSKSLSSNRQLGWIDVHFPCEGHVKAQIRILMPKEYHEVGKMAAIIKAILATAGIPEDETYEATFFDPANRVVMTQATDRHGMTDRI